MKRSKLIAFGLIFSIILNLVMFQQITGKKDESRLAHFEEIHNGIKYSYEFGDTLNEKYNGLSLDEKVEYLTAMHWSLTLSAWTIEDVNPNDKQYSDFVNLLNIYRNIPTELQEMIRNKNTDEAVLNLLTIWLKDMNYIKENLNYVQLSKADDKEILSSLRSLIHGLEYENESLEEYRESFN
jgi:hypothetical protein